MPVGPRDPVAQAGARGSRAADARLSATGAVLGIALRGGNPRARWSSRRYRAQRVDSPLTPQFLAHRFGCPRGDWRVRGNASACGNPRGAPHRGSATRAALTPQVRAASVSPCGDCAVRGVALQARGFAASRRRHAKLFVHLFGCQGSERQSPRGLEPSSSRRSASGTPNTSASGARPTMVMKPSCSCLVVAVAQPPRFQSWCPPPRASASMW